jgi:hypothetical protein
VHAQVLVEDIVVASVIIVIVEWCVVLRRPGAVAQPVVAAAPLAWAGVVVVVVQVDTEAEATRPLRIGLPRILPGPGEGEV